MDLWQSSLVGRLAQHCRPVISPGLMLLSSLRQLAEMVSSLEAGVSLGPTRSHLSAREALLLEPIQLR